MNKNKLNYVLLAGVAVLWGGIFYRIFSGISGNPENFEPSVVTRKRSLSATVDTFQLLANYQDPFLKGNYNGETKQNIYSGASIRARPATRVKEPVVKPEVQQETPVRDYVHYLGMALNGTGIKKTKVAWLKIRGVEMCVKEGQTIENLQILQFDKEKIILVKAGQKEKTEIRLGTELSAHQ